MVRRNHGVYLNIHLLPADVPFELKRGFKMLHKCEIKWWYSDTPFARHHLSILDRSTATDPPADWPTWKAQQIHRQVTSMYACRVAELVGGPLWSVGKGQRILTHMPSMILVSRLVSYFLLLLLLLLFFVVFVVFSYIPFFPWVCFVVRFSLSQLVALESASL